MALTKVSRELLNTSIVDNGNSTAITIDSSENVMFGTTSLSPAQFGGIIVKKGVVHALEVWHGFFGQQILSPYMRFYYGQNTIGSIVATNTSTISYNTTSDYRLKEDIQPITDATATVLSLNPCNFKWKEGGERNNGFIAHELQEVVPEAVTGEKDAMVTDEDGNESPEYQGVDQSKLVPLLVATIQELEARITELENS